MSLQYSPGISEESSNHDINLDQPLRIAVHSSDISNKGHTKTKSVQDVIDIRGFHKVISRGFIERHECKMQILLVGVVYGIFDETEVGINNSVEYPITLMAA